MYIHRKIAAFNSLILRNNISKVGFVSYVIISLVILYFSFFVIFGQNGLLKMIDLKKKINDEDFKKAYLENKAKIKKDMVKKMSPESLDVDLLDEQARKVLGYASEDEVILYDEDLKN